MAATQAGIGRFKLRSPFRLRTLLVLVAVIGLLCAWEINRLQRRAQAVALLEQWNLDPGWEYIHTDEFPWRLLPERDHARWVRWRIRYTDVELWGVPCAIAAQAMATNDQTAELYQRKSRMPRKPTLAERRQLVSAIAALAELRSVQFPFEFDDEDLRAISDLAGVKILGFTTRKISDVSIRYIQKLRKVEILHWHFDSVSRLPIESIKKLNAHPSLLILILSGAFPREDVECIRDALPCIEVEFHEPSMPLTSSWFDFPPRSPLALPPGG